MIFKNNPKVIWLTGLSGSGKTFASNVFCNYLKDNFFKVYLIDGDEFRAKYSHDLSFTRADVSGNIKRMYIFAKQKLDEGFYVIVAAISPFLQDRQDAKNFILNKNFIEVYLSASVSICEKRDVKGLYMKARNNEIMNMAGIHFLYEPSLSPDIIIDSSNVHPKTLEQACLDLKKLL